MLRMLIISPGGVGGERSPSPEPHSTVAELTSSGHRGNQDQAAAPGAMDAVVAALRRFNNDGAVQLAPADGAT